MSTEAAASVSSLKAWLRSIARDQTRVRIMRYAVGVTLSASLAYGFNWFLSFLLPVLVSFMLSLPLPAPSLASGLRNMWHTLVAFGFGLLFALLFLQFPFVFLLMLGLVMYQLYGLYGAVPRICRTDTEGGRPQTLPGDDGEQFSFRSCGCFSKYGGK